MSDYPGFWNGMEWNEWNVLSSPIARCQSDGRDQLKWLANEKRTFLNLPYIKKAFIGDIVYMSPLEKGESHKGQARNV